jgi:hypothetical protein
MLTRMNRTSSALRNRLNLGTRPLALRAGFVNVTATQRCIRHDHLGKRMDSMRGGLSDSQDASIARYPSEPAIPSSPGSSACPAVGQVKRVRGVVVVAEIPPVPQEVVPHGQPCWTGGPRSWQPQRQSLQPLAATFRAAAILDARVALGG